MIYQLNKEDRERIDKILIDIAAIECTLGKDSTEEEKRIAKNKQKKMNDEIRTINMEFYDVIMGNEDQKRTPDVLDFFKKTFSGDNLKKTLDKGFSDWVKKLLNKPNS